MISSKKMEIIDAFIYLYNKYDSVDFKSFKTYLNILKQEILSHFSSVEEIELLARELKPDNFNDYKIINSDLVSFKNKAKKIIQSNNRFVITSVVVGCSVDERFLASIDMYCKVNNAQLLILLSSDPAGNSYKNFNGTIDKIIKDRTIIVDDARINNNCFISAIKLSAKHIDPTTGLDRIGQRNGSFIYASPKQRLKTVPIANNEIPHVIMTTGALTYPEYDTERYMSKRTGYIANHDHVMGAIVVEKQDDEIFHFRQIQADQYGHLIDLGVKYSPGCYQDVSPQAFILGDLHAGETDPEAYNAWMEAIKKLHPKMVVLHDVFNGSSINPHEENQFILKSKKSEKGLLSLQDEISILAKYLSHIACFADKVVIVKSNHDLFLESYLQQGKYVKDYQNYKFSLELALALANDIDPLKYATEKFIPENLQQKIQWLSLDEDLIIEGVQLGSHGHIGPQGKRNPPLSAIEKSYKDSVTAHNHGPEILRGAYRVGTTSILNPDYRHGPSSWLFTSCLLYNQYQKQLIHCIKGKWKLEK